MEIIADGDALIVRVARRAWTLEQLLENMTPEAMRDAFDEGDDVGRERIDD